MTKNILGAVLCGGKSTRMQGLDKGLVKFNGQEMANYSISALSECQQVIINANRNIDSYKEIFKLTVIEDTIKGFKGPLAGILSAMIYAKKIGCDWVLTAPCDSPFINTTYTKKMFSQIDKYSNNKIFMASDGFKQPVFTLINIDLIADLQLFIISGESKIIIFYTKIGYINVEFGEINIFKNINKIEELI